MRWKSIVFLIVINILKDLRVSLRRNGKNFLEKLKIFVDSYKKF